MNKPYCYAPFVHLYQHYSSFYGDTTLDTKICCVAKKSMPSRSNLLESKWDSKYMQEVRQRMLTPNSKFPECVVCQQREDNGGNSDRMYYRDRYENKNIQLDIEKGNQYGQPIDIDIRLSNLCNLKCRMCSSSSSSQWDKEFKKNKEELKSFYSDHEILGVWQDLEKYEDVYEKDAEKNLTYLKKLMEFNKLERIKFLGGEPTLMPGVIDLLEHMIKFNQTDVELFFTTNCTNDNPKFVETIKHFTNVRFHYSVDGVKDTVEYIRAPVKWKTINEHIDVLTYLNSSKDINPEVNITIQAYNIHNLKDYVYWLKDVNERTSRTVGLSTVVLHTPYYLSFEVLPLEYRNKYIKELLEDPIMEWDVVKHSPFKSSLQFMLSTETVDTKGQTAFIEYTKKFDKIRSQHINDYIPELAEMVYGK